MSHFERDLEMGPSIALPNVDRFHFITFMPPEVSEASIAPPPSRRQPARRERSKQVDQPRPKAKAPPKRAMSEQIPQKGQQKKMKTAPTSLVLRIPIRPMVSRPATVPQPEQTREAIKREAAQPKSQGEGGLDPIILPVVPEHELVEVPVRDKSAVSAS